MKINWKGTKNREIMYSSIRMVLGPLEKIQPEARLSTENAKKVEDIMRSTCLLPTGPLIGAIGMQFRWAVTCQSLTSVNQIKISLANKLEAMKAQYMTVNQGLGILIKNGFDPAKTDGLLKAHIAGVLNYEEVLVIMNYRKAHPLML
jgi:hypothetical protein